MATSPPLAAPSVFGRLPAAQLLPSFLIAYTLTAASLAGANALWGKPGTDLVVVGLGWPHVILGFLFYFNKVLKNEGSQRSAFVWLMVLTLAIGAVHYQWPITSLIYLYFSYHAFRDEIFIYFKRLTGQRFGGALFARSGWALLAATVALAAFGQLWWLDAMRKVEIPVSKLQLRGDNLISFAPIAKSHGRDYFFSLVTPPSAKPLALEAYASTSDVYGGGHLFEDGKAMRNTDLLFSLHYAGGFEERASANTSAMNAAVPVPIAGEQGVGQSYHATADNLDGIRVPLRVSQGSPPDAKLILNVEPAFAAIVPHIPEIAIGLAIFGLVALLAFFGAPRGMAERFPEASYLLPVFFLLTAGMVLKGLAFLVVFHYFSWYVFYLEKLRPARAREPVPVLHDATALDRMLARIGTRNGFIATIVTLNLLSLAGAYSYQVLHLSGDLAYLFQLNYFLYFLVFHVTMSFAPKGPSKVAPLAAVAA
jgi:hypothetical protein